MSRSVLLTSAFLVACGARTNLDQPVDGGPSDSGAQAHPACGTWPMVGHDPARTSRSPFTGPRSAHVRWSFALGQPAAVAPVIASDGTIYAADVGAVHAVSASGEEQWKVGIQIPEELAIGCDGSLYVLAYGADPSSSGERLLALSPVDGTSKWEYAHLGGGATGVINSPVPFGADIYVRTFQLDTIRTDGTLEWQVPRYIGTSNLAVDSAGTAYACSNPIVDAAPPTAAGRTLSATSANGSTQWSDPLPNGVGGIVLLDDGVLYVGNGSYEPDSCRLSAFDLSGAWLWEISLMACVRGPMAVAPDGDLYAATSSGLLAVTPSTHGQRLAWTPTGPWQFMSPPVIDAEGFVYVMTQPLSPQAVLAAIRPDDTVAFTFTWNTGSIALVPPALGDGVLYLVGASGLQAIGP